MRTLALASLLILGGCASDDAALKIQHDPVYIKTPVPCVAASDVPVRPGALGPHPADARQGEAIAVAKVREWESYGDHAAPLLDACVK